MSISIRMRQHGGSENVRPENYDKEIAITCEHTTFELFIIEYETYCE